MNEKIHKFLLDVLSAIENIDQFIGTEKIFEIYVADLKTKSAVERQLGIIGEAVGKIIKEDATIPIQNIKAIINLRNRLVHSYDNINDSMIWAIIINHLPKLKEEIDHFINNQTKD